jgi:hypothetical protein
MVLRSGDEVRWPRQKSPRVERRRARLPVTRQAGAFLEVPQLFAPDRRSLPHFEGERKEKAQAQRQ